MEVIEYDVEEIVISSVPYIPFMEYKGMGECKDYSDGEEIYFDADK